jgi:hypothetical protein
MRRARGLAAAAVAVALLTTVFSAGLAGTADAATAAPPWTSRADAAIARVAAVDSGSEDSATYALAAGAIAAIHGWHDTRVAAYLEKVYAQRKPDGGYGLNRPWDAFGDGTVNPATTTYAITVTGQVGRVLLDGFLAGVVPRAEIRRLVDIVAAFPRTPDVPGKTGICVAYSNSGYDAATCVTNINASAGRFLALTQKLGFTFPGERDVLAGIKARVASGYDPDTGFWPYKESSPAPNDWNHNAVNAEAELVLSPPIGRDAVGKMAALTDPPTWIDPLGQITLLPYSCASEEGKRAAFDAILADQRMNASYYAQAAYWAAFTATACGRT